MDQLPILPTCPTGTFQRGLNAPGVFLLFLVFAAFLYGEAWTADFATEDRDGTGVTIEVGRHGRPLIVPVTVGGIELPFLLDTGAGKSAVDIEIARNWDKPNGRERIRTSNGFSEVPVYETQRVEIKSLELAEDCEVLGIDLSLIRYATGEEIQGILGMDLLKNLVIKIDFDEGKVEFLPALQSGQTAIGEMYGLRWERGCPTAKALLPSGKGLQFFVDTGANTSSIATSTFDDLFDAGLLRAGKITNGLAVNGEFQSQSGVLQELSIGAFSVPNKVITRDPLSVLGLDFFSRFKVILNFPQSQLYLERGEKFSRPEPTATSGMSILAIRQQKIVAKITVNGPADRAGLQMGDVLVSVGDRQIQHIDMFELKLLLTHYPGTTVPVRYLRNGTTKSVGIQLERR